MPEPNGMIHTDFLDISDTSYYRQRHKKAYQYFNREDTHVLCNDIHDILWYLCILTYHPNDGCLFLDS